MALDRIVQKNFGVLVLFGAAISAFLSALGVVRIAEAAVVPDAVLLASAPPPRAAPAATGGNLSHNASARNVTADPILARNPFDSLTGPLLHDAAGAHVATDAELASAPTCNDVKVLIIAQSADPAWSFASMSNAAVDAKSQLRRRGDDFSGKRVEFVSWDRVWLSTSGAICQAELFKSTHEVKPTKADAPRTTSDPAIAKGLGDSHEPVPRDYSRGIHRLSANEFQIDRSIVDKILETQAELMKVRVVPEQEKGKPVGVRLFGIKAGSLLDAVGFENADRIDSINGLEITSPQSALEAYARLRVADHLAVKINRKGSEMEIDYDIH